MRSWNAVVHVSSSLADRDPWFQPRGFGALHLAAGEVERYNSVMLVPAMILATALTAQPAPPAPPLSDPIAAWDALEKAVRDGLVTPEVARAELLRVVAALRQAHPTREDRRWTVPVRGGRVAWLGGRNGEGFRPNGPRPAYSWYDGNKHGGHPAHDVFIPDRNRDCLHDRTRDPFIAVAMQPGVVASINTGWAPGEPRGGKYVWLYQSATDRFYYYAHLNRVDVRPGQRVQAGDALGTVGNTGFPADRANKPCHIHLMALDVAGGAMKPYDYFRDLSRRR